MLSTSQVWNICFQTVSLSASAGTLSGPQAIAIGDTCLQGAEIFWTERAIGILENQANDLKTILGLNLAIGSASGSLSNRIIGMESYQALLTSIIPTSGNVNLNSSAFYPFDLITASNSFSGEPLPSNLYYGNISIALTSYINDFQTIQSALISYYGLNPQPPLDTLDKLLSSAITIQNELVNSLNSGTFFANITQTFWNSVFGLPLTLSMVNFAISGPFSQELQQELTARYILLTLANNFYTYAATVTTPEVSSPNFTYSRQGENLMDIANRSLGDYEQWQTLATINNIQGGEIIPTGTQVFLQPIGNYSPPSLNSAMGTDIYIGDGNGIMPPWNGDFQIITGLKNLNYALERRLLTTLGTFVYHPNYGSRIPPEVGNIQSTQTASQIGAFAQAAILADPRVAGISNQSLGMPAYGAITYSAIVQAAQGNTSVIDLGTLSGLANSAGLSQGFTPGLFDNFLLDISFMS